MSDRTRAQRLAVTVELPADQAADLVTFARAMGGGEGRAVSRIVSGWIGPRANVIRPGPASGKAAKREAAARRLAILQAWIEGGRRGAAGGVSLATLYNWERRWRAGGLDGLIDGRGSRPRTAFAPFMKYVRRRILSSRRTLKTRELYEAAKSQAAQHGWAVPSLWTVRRLVRRTVRAKKPTIGGGD